MHLTGLFSLFNQYHCEDPMCTARALFLPILFTLTITINTFSVAEISIVIERSPSASLDRVDFFHSIETRLQAAETSNPDANFSIDYSTILINLFSRLESEKPYEFAEWKDAFHDHATRLARYHRVHGLKFTYRGEKDVSLISAIIEPLLLANKLKSLSLRSFCQCPE